MSTEIHKKQWFKTIFSTGKWYLVSSFFSKGLAVLLLPLYTRYLTPTEYGQLNALNSLGQFLPILMSLYLDAAFVRFFHDLKHNPERLSKLFSTYFWFMSLLGIFVTIGACAIFTQSDFFHIEGVTSFWVVLAMLPVLLQQLAMLGIVHLRQSLESRRTTSLDIVSTLFSLGISIPLLVILHLGIEARLWGLFLAPAFLFVYYTSYFWKQGILRWTWDGGFLKMGLIYSIPLLPNLIGIWVNTMSDRLILSKYVDLRVVGLYGFAANIAQLIYILQDAITQVTGPISLSGLIADKENTKKRMAHLLVAILVVFLGADLVLTGFSELLLNVLATKDYAGVSEFVGILGLVYVLNASYRVFTDVIVFHKKTWIISTGALLMALISLSLNMILIPHFGAYAAAWVTVLATLAYTLWFVFWVQKLEPLPLQWKLIISVLALFGCSFCGIQWVMTWSNGFERMLWNGLICLVYLFVIAVLYRRGVLRHAR